MRAVSTAGRPKPNHVARADDERVLRMLALRTSLSSGAIARRLGATPEFVRTATQRVRAADFAESGEPEDVVAAGYDWSKAQRA